MSARPRSGLLLTHRALRDLQGVLAYSTEQWGKTVAEQYIDALEAGLERLREQPDLLRPEPDLHPALRFYRVNRHLFVCDARPGAIVVLTVIHSSMDIPSRLGELQPSLAAEVEILHRRLHGSRSRKS